MARELLESEGSVGLSMRRLADRLGIRAPSLYSHFADKQALENALIADGLREFGELSLTAIQDDDPVAAYLVAYRTWANAHPHLYRLSYVEPLDSRVDPAAAERAGEAIRILTRGDQRAGRSLWAYAHGLSMLELDSRFGPGATVDDVWQFGIDALRAALRPQGG